MFMRVRADRADNSLHFFKKEKERADVPRGSRAAPACYNCEHVFLE